MRPEFQALLMMIPCILITAVAFDRVKTLTKVSVGDKVQFNQLLDNIRQAQLGIVESILDDLHHPLHHPPTIHTPTHLIVVLEKISYNYTAKSNVSFVNTLSLPRFNYTKVKATVVSLQNNSTDSARKTLRSIYTTLIEQMQRDMPSDAESPFDLAVFLNKTIFEGNWNTAVHFIVSLSAPQNETRVDDFFRSMLE